MMPSARSTRSTLSTGELLDALVDEGAEADQLDALVQRARAGVARRVHRQHLADGEDALDPDDCSTMPMRS